MVSVAIYFKTIERGLITTAPWPRPWTTALEQSASQDSPARQRHRRISSAKSFLFNWHRVAYYCCYAPVKYSHSLTWVLCSWFSVAKSDSNKSRPVAQPRFRFGYRAQLHSSLSFFPFPSLPSTSYLLPFTLPAVSPSALPLSLPCNASNKEFWGNAVSSLSGCEVSAAFCSKITASCDTDSKLCL